MKLIIGLGNPGAEYKRTRHNLGFRILDALAQDRGASLRLKKDVDAEVAETHVGREKVILVKPQTYMNRSGYTAQALVRFYHLQLDDCWVVHDDIDLASGKVKVQRGRSSAGHRGVEDIIRALGSSKFYRFRIGIDTRTTDQLTHDTNRFVMTKFSREDEILLERLIPRFVALLLDALRTTPERAISVWGKEKTREEPRGTVRM